MNVTIDPIKKTQTPFCEHPECFGDPQYAVVVRDMITGTENVLEVCGDHVKDSLPSFAEAS